jgi:hypothetical protein
MKSALWLNVAIGFNVNPVSSVWHSVQRGAVVSSIGWLSGILRSRAKLDSGDTPCRSIRENSSMKSPRLVASSGMSSPPFEVVYEVHHHGGIMDKIRGLAVIDAEAGRQ